MTTNVIKETTPEDEISRVARDERKQDSVTIHLRAHLPDTILHKLRGVFDLHPGRFRVYFAVDNAGGQQKILSSYRIKFDELIAKELEGILGPDSVKVEA